MFSNVRPSANKKNRGVALLYAVLMVSIVLTISLSLLNITFKQIVLTAVSKESQKAHFIAWSTLNCIYRTDRFYRSGLNDTDQNPFGKRTVTPSLQVDVTTGNSFTCGSGSGLINGSVLVAPALFIPGSKYILSSYRLTGPGLTESCAIVDIVKVESGNFSDDYGPEAGGFGPDPGRIFYNAAGYNLVHPCASPPETSSRLVERRARTRY